MKCTGYSDGSLKSSDKRAAAVAVEAAGKRWGEEDQKIEMYTFFCKKGRNFRKKHHVRSCSCRNTAAAASKYETLQFFAKETEQC